jgi:hypothetical protein
VKIKVEHVKACMYVVEAPQEVNAGKGNSEEEERPEVKEKEGKEIGKTVTFVIMHREVW